MTPIEKRVAAAQATLNHFKDKPFEWGRADCATLAAYALRQLGKTTPLRSFGVYRSALGAKRALKRRGFTGMDQVMDDLGYERISPARVLPGDIVGLDGDGGIALTVSVGNGRVFGFLSPDRGLEPRGVVMQPRDIPAAWRSL